MSNEPIPPALSPNEWLGVTNPNHDDAESFALSHQSGKLGWFIPCAVSPDALTIEKPRGPSPWRIATDDRHALAALCLWQQSFGFSMADVTAVENAGDAIASEWPVGHPIHASVAKLRSLASRIASLLPPPDAT